MNSNQKKLFFLFLITISLLLSTSAYGTNTFFAQSIDEKNNVDNCFSNQTLETSTHLLNERNQSELLSEEIFSFTNMYLNNPAPVFQKNSNDIEFITVNGYIKDVESNDPIKNANVFCYYLFDEYSAVNISNYKTDKDGFYSLNVPNYPGYPVLAKKNLYYMNYSSLPDSTNETIWLNMTLSYGRVPETSQLKGYITNKETGEPIFKATMMYAWLNDNDQIDINYTFSDASGYFEADVAYGMASILFTSATGYVMNYSGFTSSTAFWVDWEEGIWKNISLQKMPESSSNLCGYITDESTDKPVQEVSVLLFWENDIGQDFELVDHSNNDGFYSFPVPSGNGSLHITHPRYYYNEVTDIHVEENTTKWINISLESIQDSDLLTFEYIWEKKEKVKILEKPMIAKDELFEKTYEVESEQFSVLTQIDVQINWKDDHTFGLLKTKGADVLTVEVSLDGKTKEETSEFEGSFSFAFSVNSKPQDGLIKAESYAEAKEMLNQEYDGENKALFDLISSVQTGEPWWRIVQCLKDNGNPIEISVRYTFYEYDLQQLDQ